MKTVEQLEQLRDELIDNFYRESKVLASWDSTALKDEEESTKAKANSQLLSSLGSTIGALQTIVKNLKAKAPVADAAADALKRIRS